MARSLSRALLLTALAAAMALAAISAPLAAASGMFEVATAGSGLPGAFAADQAVPAATQRKLLQAACASCQSDGKLPVCGADKKTYDNACYATCAKAKVAYIGSCKPNPCVCTPTFKPVCGGGKSYINACFAKCSGVSSTKDGFCSSVCSCSGAKKPVCGLDGKTYDNQCKAYCAGTQPYYSGACDKRISTCACSLQSDPVCVKSVIVTEVPGVGTIKTPFNATYTNPCIAKCQNDPSATITKGACEAATTSYPYDVSQYMCGCGYDIQPVCAQLPILKTNFTIYNKCTAQCFKYKVLYDGECTDQCLCPTYGATDVCVGGTKPYKSACQARCAGAKDWTVGKCAKCKSCPIATSINDYVCGADGIPYQSACAAECAGVKVAYKGMCKFTRRTE